MGILNLIYFSVIYVALSATSYAATQISSFVVPEVQELSCTDQAYRIPANAQSKTDCQNCKQIVSKLKTDIKQWIQDAAAKEAALAAEAESSSANAVQNSTSKATQNNDQFSGQKNMNGAKQAMLKQVQVAKDLATKIRRECVDRLSKECMSKNFQGQTDPKNVSDLHQKCEQLAKDAEKAAGEKQAEANQMKDKEEQAEKQGEGMGSPPGMPEMPKGDEGEELADESGISDDKTAESKLLGGTSNKPGVGHIMGIQTTDNTDPNKKIRDILSPYTGIDPLDKGNAIGDGNKLYGGSGSSRLGYSGGSGSGGGATGAASKILDLNDNPESAKLATDDSSYAGAGGGGGGFRSPSSSGSASSNSFSEASEHDDGLTDDEGGYDRTYASNDGEQLDPRETLFYRIHQKIKEKAFTERL
ncbi:MAG: hypothetical protein M9962_08540 [Oligoflexia bacterium]|nr:hypothetical protein [Oligoflexia bacterium]